VPHSDLWFCGAGVRFGAERNNFGSTTLFSVHLWQGSRDVPADPVSDSAEPQYALYHVAADRTE
jgi:hypothetical protein